MHKLLVDNGSKPWANLFCNNITAYNKLIVNEVEYVNNQILQENVIEAGGIVKNEVNVPVSIQKVSNVTTIIIYPFTLKATANAGDIRLRDVIPAGFVPSVNLKTTFVAFDTDAAISVGIANLADDGVVSFKRNVAEDSFTQDNGAPNFGSHSTIIFEF